jgi:putative inorganic carbon (hco3(-)) transporter
MTAGTPVAVACVLVLAIASAAVDVLVARRRHQRPIFAVTILICATAVSVVAGVRSPLVVVVPVAIGLAIGLSWCALCRFELFALGMLVIRPSVDIAKGASDQSGPLAVAVSLGFALVAVTWLLLQPPLDADARPPVVKAAAFLGMAGLLSTLGSRDVTASLAEAARLCSGLLMFVALAACIAGSYRAARLIAAVLASSVIPCLVGLHQAAAGGGLGASGVSRVRGTFTHPNILGLYLAMLVVFGLALVPRLRGSARLAVLALMALQVVVLMQTYSRSGWLAATAGVLVVTWVQNRKALVAVVVLGLAVALLVPSVSSRLGGLGDTQRSSTGGAGNSLIWRFDYWLEALPLGRSNPVTGIGLGMTRLLTTEAKVLHNDFLRAFVEMGLVGLAAYVAMLLALFRTALRSLRRARQVDDWQFGAALGSVGAAVVFSVYAVAGNAISQVVTLWTLAAIVTAGWAATQTSRTTSLEAVHDAA